MVKTVSTPPTGAPQIAPRERILASARELFYRHGIRAVGVDAIAEAAATNKMTLYRHFGSKDELIAAYLRELAREGDEVWEGLARSYPGDPEAQLEGWVRHVETILTGGSRPRVRHRQCRGRAARDRASGAADHRRLQDCASAIGSSALFRGAGYSEPELLADEVFLLFEGARISIQCCAGPTGPASRLVGMLRSLLKHHAPRAR